MFFCHELCLLRLKNVFLLLCDNNLENMKVGHPKMFLAMGDIERVLLIIMDLIILWRGGDSMIGI